jgi:hypothetical protein
MNKERMIQIAERNLRKAEIAINKNQNRKGITELELENLSSNVEYAKIVYDLVVNHVE